MSSFFYKPVDAWAADFIPFFHEGRFYLFYLLDWRDPPNHGEGTPWYLVSTSDFVHFTEHGEMLSRGGRLEQDLYVFTGSVVQGEGKFHIFYTGHNHHLREERGQPVQGVMHAVSDDLLHWQKIPAHTFFAPTDRFEADDWRDPFVFWNEDAKEYWMLLAARLPGGPSRRRGCTALCVSKDLVSWEARSPFYAPGLYYTHECPDLFKLGDWWYLLFSEFSEACKTRYRMSHSLAGPWIAPDEDAFDGRALYAAKTASDGQHRYLFGWNPTRVDEKDYRPWQWGGNLVVHELIQEADGTLMVRPPDSVDKAFSDPLPIHFRPALGEAQIVTGQVNLRASRSFACASAGILPDRCKIEATIEFSEGTKACGLLLRMSDDYEKSYFIRLEPGKGRLVFDAWPRDGDITHMVELERPISLSPVKPVGITVLVDGSVLEVYAAGKVAMSARMYNLSSGNWGVFVQDGEAHFSHIKLAV
jgi:beta-fructofuranosidase